MTRAETISNLKAYLDGDMTIGNIIPLRSVLESAVGYLEPSLPSDLDEAAERYADDSCFDDPEFTATMLAFKAGAEWMAGQGETHELTVESPVLGPPMICCPIHADNGDKVVVQIRKK